LTVVDCEMVRAQDIKDNEVLQASLRTRAGCPRMAELVAKTKGLEARLDEKRPVPLLAEKKQSADEFVSGDERLTST